VDFLLGVNSAGKFEFATRQNKANVIVSAAAVTQADVDANRWFHLVAVQDVASGKVQLYVDGHLAAQQLGVNGTTTAVQSSLQIGSRGATGVLPNGMVSSSGSEFFNGVIDEVSIYNRPLSLADIQAHYRLGGLPGDFNGDGTVDGADYVSWRKGLNTTYTLDDFAAWRGNFGLARDSSGLAGSNVAVPEPSLAHLILLAIYCSLRGCPARKKVQWRNA
jgi:hypothetical protein